MLSIRELGQNWTSGGGASVNVLNASWLAFYNSYLSRCWAWRHRLAGAGVHLGVATTTTTQLCSLLGKVCNVVLHTTLITQAYRPYPSRGLCGYGTTYLTQQNPYLLLLHLMRLFLLLLFGWLTTKNLATSINAHTRTRNLRTPTQRHLLPLLSPITAQLTQVAELGRTRRLLPPGLLFNRRSHR